MFDGAIYSVIAPEGAATILYRDAARAAEISSKLKLTARELKKLGIVDEILPEPSGGTQADPELAAETLARSIANALAELQRKRVGRLVEERYRDISGSADGTRSDLAAICQHFAAGLGVETNLSQPERCLVYNPIRRRLAR